MRRRFFMMAALAAGPAWAGGTGLPAPGRILVVDAPDLPGLVTLDPSRAATAMRAAAGMTPQQAQASDFRAVQAALSQTLVEKITAMGLTAQRMPAGTQPPPGALAVVVQIDAIEEGNRARRMVIGFGAGQVQVRAGIMLLRGTADGPQMLHSYVASGTSGRMPGLGVGLAASGAKTAAMAASGAMHGADELTQGPVGAEAVKAANRLAANIGQYFTAQGWIAVPGDAASSG